MEEKKIKGRKKAKEGKEGRGRRRWDKGEPVNTKTCPFRHSFGVGVRAKGRGSHLVPKMWHNSCVSGAGMDVEGKGSVKCKNAP